MPVPLFVGNVVALIWDFDQTLISGYQQEPLFETYGVDREQFWNEVRALVDYYQQRGIVAAADTMYLNHLLTYVKAGRFAGLTNGKLRELGGKLTFYPGMPDFLRTVKRHVEERAEFRSHSITVEHYIVSTGLRQMILGSAVAEQVTDIWACEFIEEAAPPGFLQRQPSLPIESHEISQVGYFLDNTTKTRAIWEINKGTNRDPQIGVNDVIAEEDRRVPIRNMLYIADGPSDIPVFSVVNRYGGRTLGVYNPARPDHFRKVKALRDQGRVQHFVEADYRPGRAAAEWILLSAEEMAEAIVRDRERALRDRVRPSIGHVE